jgi:hypothetical protein
MKITASLSAVLRRTQEMGLLAALSTVLATTAQATDWNSVPIINHSTYQAVGADGSSNYLGGFPIRLVGVVLNNNEDWLNPTAAFSSIPWDLGGQAEFYVQTVASGDFGGTACWMGQNYGNLGFIGDPAKRYQNADWYNELDRLQLYHPNTTLSNAQLVRAGDLVEIDVRGGLSYAGKMNVNESHKVTLAFDFEVVVLQKNYGLPQAADLALSNLKNGANQYIFDPNREMGGEHYQSTRVTIHDVHLADVSAWGTNSDLTLVDAAGLTLPIHLGFNPSFSNTAAPTGYFDVTGILDQLASDGNNGTDGYRLLAMNASDFAAVPEPATFLLLAIGATCTIVRYAVRRRRTGNN